MILNFLVQVEVPDQFVDDLRDRGMIATVVAASAKSYLTQVVWPLSEVDSVNVTACFRDPEAIQIPPVTTPPADGEKEGVIL